MPLAELAHAINFDNMQTTGHIKYDVKNYAGSITNGLNVIARVNLQLHADHF